MEIVTAEEMRRIDEHAIRVLKIPSLDLMEQAGLRVAEVVEERLKTRGIVPAEHGGAGPSPEGVLVICGKGNNGGDGLVAGRHLRRRWWRVQVLLAADPAVLAGDAAANLRAALDAGVPIHAAPTVEEWRAFHPALAEADCLVDALLGTGLSGAARGLAATIIEDAAA